MKRALILASTITAILVLSGCGAAEPTIDDTATENQNTEVSTDVQTESVGSDDVVVGESDINSADSNEKSISGLESQLSSIYFDYDRFKIKTSQEDSLYANVKVINGNASNYMVKIEGNCDEWGSDEYNYALGLKRANTVKNALISQDIKAGRITMVSYGESSPVCTEKTQKCWSNNRRVDFKLLP